MPGTEVWKCASTAMRPCSVSFTPTLSRPSPSTQRPPADADQHDIGLQRLGRAALGRLDGQGDAGRQVVSALVTFEPSLNFSPCSGERALELLGDLVVDPGRDAVEELDHRHLRAQPPPHRAQLEADDARADHDQVLGHLGQARARRSTTRSSSRRRRRRAAASPPEPEAIRMFLAASVSLTAPSSPSDRRPSPPCRCGRCPGRRRSCSS